jgi:DNA processing protein
MAQEIETLYPKAFPYLLRQIPDAPKQLYIRGNLPKDQDIKFLTVVGSRKWSIYGKQATERLISGLSLYNIVIVSGLALGIDSFAHKIAIKSGLRTIAILPSGLGWSVLYPRTNHGLAREILSSGGALITENSENYPAHIYDFPKRNRIMAGMSHGALIIEANERSGTLITARLAMEYNREVLAVPGSIFSAQSKGTNGLIETGATPIHSAEDILDALGLDKKPDNETQNSLFNTLSAQEKKIMEMLAEPQPRDALIRAMRNETHKINILLTNLEIKGLITEEYGVIKSRIS